jgi:zinc transport system substrate-binding protein
MLLVLLCFIMCALLAAGCTRTEQAPSGPAQLTVAVTIPPQKQFVERIGGDRVRAVVLVPPGANPHTHEPTPGQLAEIGRADLYIAVGSGVEFERMWMDKIRGVNPRMPVVDSSRGIEVISGDPHIWLSPRNAMIMVNNTFEGLVAIDPGHEAVYRKNRDGYLAELDRLDRDIGESLAGKSHREVMVSHAGWAYFARDYDLHLISIEKEGKEPTPGELQDLIRRARQNNITVVFASPEFSTKSAEVIAHEIGGRVDLISPLDEDYVENLHKVSAAFAESESNG